MCKTHIFLVFVFVISSSLLQLACILLSFLLSFYISYFFPPVSSFSFLLLSGQHFSSLYFFFFSCFLFSSNFLCFAFFFHIFIPFFPPNKQIRMHAHTTQFPLFIALENQLGFSTKSSWWHGRLDFLGFGKKKKFFFVVVVGMCVTCVRIWMSVTCWQRAQELK